MSVTKFVYLGRNEDVTLQTLRFKIYYINKIYVPYKKMTRESDVLILKRLYSSDISCGT